MVLFLIEDIPRNQEVPDGDRTIAMHAPSIGCDLNQQSGEDKKKTFMTNSEEREGGIEIDSIDRSPGLCIDDEHSVSDRVCADDCVVRCDILEGRCRTHDCETKKIKVTSQQWKWKEKQKSFGFVSMKQTKLLCSARIRGSTAPVIPTRTRPATTTTQRGAADREVGRLLLSPRADNHTRGEVEDRQIRESLSEQAEISLDDMK